MKSTKNPWLTVDASLDQFGMVCEFLKQQLRNTPLIARGRVHAQDVSARPEFDVHELDNVTLTFDGVSTMEAARAHTGANMPWAEDHFQERVSGKPLNPAPSEAWWPFAQQGNKEYKNGVVFSHTYPERMWPKHAGVEKMDTIDGPLIVSNGFYSDTGELIPAYGIRYNYGDLNDLVALLVRDPFTRQAYLPIWFPEDTGSVDGQRVPCSLGYHFIRRGVYLDCQYYMRSCDLFRHFADDTYMAIRLTQWVIEQVWKIAPPPVDSPFPQVGRLTMHIANLHCFRGDEYRLG